MIRPEWTFDREYSCWNLQHQGACVSITPRPGYCDRGRWLVVVDGIDDLDFADAFPRYFMDLEWAKAEMIDWLLWRLQARARGVDR